MTLNDMMDAGIILQGKTVVRETRAGRIRSNVFFDGLWEDFLDSGREAWMDWDIAYMSTSPSSGTLSIDLEQPWAV